MEDGDKRSKADVRNGNVSRPDYKSCHIKQPLPVKQMLTCLGDASVNPE